MAEIDNNCQQQDKCRVQQGGCKIRRFFNAEIGVKSAHLVFWPVFIVFLAADLWSKAAVFEWLGSRCPPCFDIIDGFFRFVLVENKGAAWGIASGKTIPLIIVSGVAILVVFGIFLFGRRLQGVVVFSLGLFAAGICGNLYDRVFNDGRVRDFTDFYYNDIHFPAFNIADSALTVAVFLLICSTILAYKPSELKNEDCRLKN